ncbi:MAG: UDP-N-acetylmuramoyl-tripeptide--D-alanyl-D-alanine ligase, partial [Chloroflexi bacterium]|nr:UDP-N-acetylmuramoyl-tripeptide--D-alanyl-D-alanine ligase [Chloroflexota bacterium]
MIYLDHLLTATGGVLRYVGKHEYFDAFSHDTRQLVAGELFVAVRGERSDGHDYLMDAVRQGAAGLLVEARVFNALAEQTQGALEYAGVATVVVEDTRTALQQYAHFIIAHWHPLVIAVTGSVGKTSTKEAIATVLSHKYPTFRSWQNYNDLLGLPLSLGRLEERHRYAVLELGCDHPGEIADLCRIVQPQIGVLTNISATQLQYFGSVERLARELAALLSSLPAQGVALLNAEDALSRTLLLNPFELCLCTYAASSVTDVRVSWEGVQCLFKALPLSCRLLGRHHIDTMLATFHIASLCGMQAEEIQRSFADIQPLSGRLNPLLGVHGSMLLDDTHNAAPASMLAGLRTLRELPAGQRIAVVADMLNLGDYDEEAHRIVGREAACCVDYLVTRGERAAMIAESACQAGLAPERVIVTSTHEDAAQATRHILQLHKEQQTKDVVLIKGSEGMRMERVTELLMAEPTQAQQLLVRQTLGWKQIVFTRAERPTWVEVDLNAIANNTQRIKALVGPRVQVLVSLKADAYGHGAVRVARTTLHNGASMLGVATVSEATPLRQAGITVPILVFGYVPPWQMRE